MSDYGVDWDSPYPNGELSEDQEVVVPETNSPLNEIERLNLQRLIDPLRDSEHHGVDIYTDVLAFFEDCLQNTSHIS